MNFASIEYFKQSLKELNSSINRIVQLKVHSDVKQLNNISKRIEEMLEFVKDREENNKDAYIRRHMISKK
jgi:ElaB/YqjD/DUF883 family membrane-anchored ribosome-binding protein